MSHYSSRVPRRERLRGRTAILRLTPQTQRPLAAPALKTRSSKLALAKLFQMNANLTSPSSEPEPLAAGPRSIFSNAEPASPCLMPGARATRARLRAAKPASCAAPTAPDQPYTELAARALKLWQKYERRWKRQFLHRTGVLWMASSRDDSFERGSLESLREAKIKFQELSTP